MDAAEAAGVRAKETRRCAMKETQPTTQDNFLEAAKIIAHRILDARLDTTDGGIRWRHPGRVIAGEFPRMVLVGPHLYDGLPGIAIFLAALGRVDGLGEYRALSFEIIAPLRSILIRFVAEPKKADELTLEIGGLAGLGSFIYSFATLSRLLDAPDLMVEAHQISSLITLERIAADRALDIVSGAAGAILALLAIDRHISGPNLNGETPLSVASHCARHILSCRVTGAEGTTAWKTDSRYPPLNGFAHGAAGICCALLKLYAKTGETELYDAAQKGWAFERTTYSEQANNWRDQTSSESRFVNQWCYGAPGITLGRIATLHIADSPFVQEEIRNGLETTSSPTLSNFDHICCGDMGRVEVLLYAYQKFKAGSLLKAAHKISRRVLRRAEAAGHYRGMVQSDQFDPTFFAGTSGIGYTLLRLMRPTDLPSILAME